MNYITAAKNTKKLSETELKQNISGKASWHYQYKDSAWIYIGGLPYDLTEGDIICVFSQYGEVVNLNLPRDKKTGKSKGFCFLCYEDQRSTILAVDNLNTIKICGRIIRVDHVEEYKVPKNIDKLDDDALRLLEEGCGPESSVVRSLQGQQGSSILKDDKPKREQELDITESQHSWGRSMSPQEGNERNRHPQEDYRRVGERPNGSSCDQHKDSKSSRHRERKDDHSARRDHKDDERTNRRNEEHHSSHVKRRQDERPRDYDKERSKTSDYGRRERSRHDERSKHRDRSRSRDRVRKLRS